MSARASEPAPQEAYNEDADERHCLNCGARIAGEYCHACGQKTHVHRSLSAFWHDLLHSVAHFDGKLWRTLPMLTWKPGELTRRYIHGERASFVSPIALFLFTVFLMFAIFSMLGLGAGMGGMRNSSADIKAALEEEKSDLTELRRRRMESAAKNEAAEVRQIDEEIREKQAGMAALNAFLSSTGSSGTDIVGGKTGWKRIDDGIKKLNDNPALALYKIQTNAYKFSWALIPISVPFVWLLFLHRRRYRQFGAYDHIVFVTYSITFMSMLLLLIVLIAQFPGTQVLRNVIAIIAPIHMYRQLRGAYELSRWSAAWRAMALIILSFLAITLFLLLLLALGILG
jgi:hypothetical protein